MLFCCIEPGDSLRGKALCLALKCSVDLLSHCGQREPDAASVRSIRLRVQQAPFFEPLDQAPELSLVSSAMGDQFTLRGTWMDGEEREHFAVHVSDVMGAVAQKSVLQRAVFMHDGVHEVQQIVWRVFHRFSSVLIRKMVDIVSLYL